MEITEEPLSIIAQDDPVTCGAYAKEHNLLHLPEWNKLKHRAKHQKSLTRAINQTKNRQLRRSATYQFGYLIPRDYKHALVTEVDNLQGIYPLKDEWVFGCSLKTRLADQTKTQQLKCLWSKDSMNSTINQRLVEQTQEMNFKLEGSGGSTWDDTLRKQYLSSSDE